MSQEKKKDKSDQSGPKTAVGIDYKNIDVARIMEGIKKSVTVPPLGGPRDVVQPSSASGVPASSSRGEEGPGGDTDRRQKIKRVLLKVMSPFSPLIKLMILPVYEEQRQIFLAIHTTNQRLDEKERELEKLREYTRLLHNLCHNLVVELSKLKIEEEMLKTKTQILEKDFEFMGKRESALEKEVFK
jgi:hypothetical protein